MKIPHFSGDIHTDSLHRTLYATDASVYRSPPRAVLLPRDEADLAAALDYCRERDLPIIPRGGGTSLAGQVVGSGVVIDTSKYLDTILDLDESTGRVRVQPGVIRDELNAWLEPRGWYFGPLTSTANRATIGGMVGNNSSGTTSIVYGTTREHTHGLRTLLSDGSAVDFGPLSETDFRAATRRPGLEGQLYARIAAELSPADVRSRIVANYPHRSIHRRNTGYAIDLLAEANPFTPDGPDFNFCQLLAGSEGTLALTTEITLQLDPLPPAHGVVLAAHFTSIDLAMRAVPTCLLHGPTACELMDRTILELSKQNRAQRANRFFVEGSPEGLLLIEFRGESPAHARSMAEGLAKELGAAYATPIVSGPDIPKVWALRAAGLGILANLPGDEKAVACIEDTAVRTDELAAYIAEFTDLMQGFGQQAIYYAHAGAGEIHLRPVLDLKKNQGRAAFREITTAVAELVKKYGGSLSGEHGDGRLRGEFIPRMIGPENYELLRRIKHTWDPDNRFNPGKIVDTPPMDEQLRYEAEQPTREFATALDFSATGGLLRLAEKCNGSGDCRKVSGGAMCPSYRATRREADTTRGRANVLREVLTRTEDTDPWQHPDLAAALDLCISCKACAAECPSNVDMASLKAEYLHQRAAAGAGHSLRSRAFANIGRVNRLLSVAPGLANFMLRLTAGLSKRILNVASQRSLPELSGQSVARWWKSSGRKLPVIGEQRGEIVLFIDEFTNYTDADAGRAAAELFLRLGYRVHLPALLDSGRAALSKGLLNLAKTCAAGNVARLSTDAYRTLPVVGVEPSAILGLRDEYPKLLRGAAAESAAALAERTYDFGEFLAREIGEGRITAADFDDLPRRILLHAHCHQKALGGADEIALALSLPAGHLLEVIPSGCCGMAGSFGYEAEHYAVSQQIGEDVLFPALRRAAEDVIVAAPGTSCRHQIADGVGRAAVHPAVLLRGALRVRG